MTEGRKGRTPKPLTHWVSKLAEDRGVSLDEIEAAVAELRQPKADPAVEAALQLLRDRGILAEGQKVEAAASPEPKAPKAPAVTASDSIRQDAASFAEWLRQPVDASTKGAADEAPPIPAKVLKHFTDRGCTAKAVSDEWKYGYRQFVTYGNDVESLTSGKYRIRKDAHGLKADDRIKVRTAAIMAAKGQLPF